MDVDRLERLTQKVGGRFKLTSLLQKRLAELVKGSPALVEIPSNNFMEIALQEIEEGRVELLRPWTTEQPPQLSPASVPLEEGQE